MEERERNGVPAEVLHKGLEDDVIYGLEIVGDLGKKEFGSYVDVSEVGGGLNSGTGNGHCFNGGEDRKSDCVYTPSSMEISKFKESPLSGGSPSPSSPSRPGLEHSKTAPMVYDAYDNLFERHELTLPRSKTEKKETPKHDLKIDRLPEHEKKKIIENIVKIQNNGTVEVDVARSAPVASELLELDSGLVSTDVEDTTMEFNKPVPRLKIAMLVVGTRGDVQPFLAIAKRLQEFGHQVRFATHANFRNFVRSAGIDFYPLGGDPRILAGYMARNKGFLPSGPAEISEQRKQLKAIIHSLLPACTEPDLDSGAPFRAQAIIANPPAYGHAHVAEALGASLHIFFTMPWTPTHEFPHPLARVPQSAGYKLSYLVVDLIIWWSIRGFINDFRRKKLKLSPIAYFSTYHGSISHFPTGYMWSPHLVPKPSGSKYQPQKEFVQWIEEGPKPIYIGFGSMPLDDAKKTTDIILGALKDTGQRGIIDRGWGDLGILPELPDDIFLLEECPHDWLFPQCAAVVHHGGAGTTATGLRAGCPTAVVPFFGDQFFWGDRIHAIGLGPAPIPISELSIEGLSNSIRFMLNPEVKLQAMELAKKIENEDGVAAAVNAFHRHLPPELPMRTASLNDPAETNPLQWLLQLIEKYCCLPCAP
ncbi:sterol 3-beta-glucosyltransferase UGT80B1 isoform X2 [Magnolia sinica]|uniref:sterol 3-beta-glucosyltransferase UGT80B1 isoform X2 n=1 Tax=Magnolia sinica TaxID=86752 RepID=UPI002659E211|nr:sterol 3-beta-glucosyltransferase UGT80B1 isoform X2 [Magnolia sinica]